MHTTLSSAGEVILPATFREKLGLRAGDSLDASLEGERIVLQRSSAAPVPVKMAIDEVTGLPVLLAAADAPPLTSKAVADLLTDFP